MRIKIYLLLLQNILYNQYQLINATPLVGENVRLARDEEFPSVVSIKVINRNNREMETNHGCVGTVITKNKVLSVAHGIAKVPFYILEVHVGSNDLRQGKKLEIQRIFYYNRWAVENKKSIEFLENDIAIIALKTNVPSEIIPVNYEFIKTSELDGKEVITAGWGRTENGNKSRYLQTVSLEVINHKDCIQRIEDVTKRKCNLDARFICTHAEPYAFIRKGDSGGPLFFGGKLVGLNKASSPLPEDNFHPQKVNLHVGIHYYKDFILDIINKH